MVIFLNGEGFELIANAALQGRAPKRSLPVAYFGGTGVVMLLYVTIAAVTLAHLAPATLAAHSVAALSYAAKAMTGYAGLTVIAVAALAATSSAINATYYGSGRFTYLIAKHGELSATSHLRA
jgi:amino acid transporter